MRQRVKPPTNKRDTSRNTHSRGTCHRLLNSVHVATRKPLAAAAGGSRAAGWARCAGRTRRTCSFRGWCRSLARPAGRSARRPRCSRSRATRRRRKPRCSCSTPTTPRCEVRRCAPLSSEQPRTPAPAPTLVAAAHRGQSPGLLGFASRCCCPQESIGPCRAIAVRAHTSQRCLRPGAADAGSTQAAALSSFVGSARWPTFCTQVLCGLRRGARPCLRTLAFRSQPAAFYSSIRPGARKRSGPAKHRLQVRDMRAGHPVRALARARFPFVPSALAYARAYGVLHPGVPPALLPVPPASPPALAQPLSCLLTSSLPSPSCAAHLGALNPKP